MSSYIIPQHIFTILLVLIFVVAIYKISYTHNYNEGFVQKVDCNDANYEDTDLMKIDGPLGLGNNLLQSPIHYISVDMFNIMVINLQTLIVTTLKEQALTCSDMNGSDGLEKKHMTFNCINDVGSIQNIVIGRLTSYIIKYIKYFYNINMNPQLIISDFKNNLNLLDNLIYPLLYSHFYTVHGINYFTDNMLINKVTNNLKLKNVLYTILQRRGIEVIPNTDNHL
jgi:hypothetical protein